MLESATSESCMDTCMVSIGKSNIQDIRHGSNVSSNGLDLIRTMTIRSGQIRTQKNLGKKAN